MNRCVLALACAGPCLRPVGRRGPAVRDGRPGDPLPRGRRRHPRAGTRPGDRPARPSGAQLKVWGSPWTAIYGAPGKAFQVPREELEAKWALIPSDTDILVRKLQVSSSLAPR
jgi:hypothetical protein